MRVTIRIEVTNRKFEHYQNNPELAALPVNHNLDLYNDVHVEKLIRKAAERLEVGTLQLTKAIADITRQLELYRLEQIEQQQVKAEKQKKILTPDEKEKAINFLMQPGLMQRTNEIIGISGVLGEEANRLLMYIIFTSIQSKLQGLRDQTLKGDTKGLERSMMIVLDKKTATITAVDGPNGTNDKVNIPYTENTAGGKSWNSVEDQPNLIIVGQAHSHPESNKANTYTEATASEPDANAAKKMGAPVYAVNARGGKPGSPGNIHRVAPDGTKTDGIGETIGSNPNNPKSINIGLDAFKIYSRN